MKPHFCRSQNHVIYDEMTSFIGILLMITASIAF